MLESIQELTDGHGRTQLDISHFHLFHQSLSYRIVRKGNRLLGLEMREGRQ